MPPFREGQPVVTTVPRVTVDAGLPPGTYRFQLVVENQSGRQSAPTVVVVVVRR